MAELTLESLAKRIEVLERKLAHLPAADEPVGNNLVPPTPGTRPPIPNGQERVRQIAEQQGTLHTSTVENLVGSGQGLWDSDEEFDAFLERIQAGRRDKE